MPPWEMFAIQQANNTNHPPEPTCCSHISVVTTFLPQRCIESFSRLGSDLSVKNESGAADEILCNRIGPLGLPRREPKRSILSDHRQYELAISFGFGTAEKATKKVWGRWGFLVQTLSL